VTACICTRLSREREKSPRATLLRQRQSGQTTSASSQVVALVLTNVGLMADASVNGAEVTRLNL
jgi:hypothetical protein